MSDNPMEKPRGKIADYLPLIQAADGLTLGQVCKLSSLEPSTVQNWIKRGYVPHPVGKKYRERHLARILLICELREIMQIDRVGTLLRYINGDTDDESDDIITEEALYDLFCDIMPSLSDGRCSPEAIREAVEKATAASYEGENAKKLTNALEIMAHAYAANMCKRSAEALFSRYITGTEG